MVFSSILFLFYYITLSFRRKNKFYEFVAKKFPSFVNNINEIFQKNINQKQVYLTIIYSTLIEFDTSLLKETWLIRSDVSLENYYPIQKKEANYYWIENQDMSIIKKVKELDKNSFIALWR